MAASGFGREAGPSTRGSGSTFPTFGVGAATPPGTAPSPATPSFPSARPADPRFPSPRSRLAAADMSSRSATAPPMPMPVPSTRPTAGASPRFPSSRPALDPGATAATVRQPQPSATRRTEISPLDATDDDHLTYSTELERYQKIEFLKWLEDPDYSGPIKKIKAEDLVFDQIEGYCRESVCLFVELNQIPKTGNVKRTYGDHRWHCKGNTRDKLFEKTIYQYQKKKKGIFKDVEALQIEEIHRIGGSKLKALWRFLFKRKKEKAQDNTQVLLPDVVGGNRALQPLTEQCLGTEMDSHHERYDKKLCATAISNLERKIKALKQEQAQLSLEAHDWLNEIPDLRKLIGEVQALVAQREDLKLKYYEEMEKRKKLHNIVQEMKGNIRVFCRCRPLSKDEVSSGQKCVVDFEGSSDGNIVIANGGATKNTFKFDRVFTPKDDQDVVYADASPLVTSVLDGYNVCIFAYGQTGTGKTFTMEGTERNRGVNYRTLEELFKIAEERKESVMYDLSVNVLEVYNEQIRDLLDTSPSKKLEIKQSIEGQSYVPGLVEAKIENIKEVWDVLRAGSNARAVGSNNVNEHSSRSHCMLCIMVRAKNLLNGECTSSKLWLVDLAGSERLAKTDVQGERLKETKNINRSLSALGDVISALTTKSSHIPYRNSKLTQLLQDSLGGGSKALMFVQISPSDNDISETLSSLNFASRVQRIEMGPAKKQVDTFELQKTKQMLERAKQELRLKDDCLRKLEENLQNLETKAKGKEQLCKNFQEKVSEKQRYQLSGKLKEKGMCTSVQHKIVDFKYKLRQPHQSESEVALLKQTNKELELRLKEQEHQQSVAELKIKELELKLKEQEHQRSVVELKQRDLESKTKELESIVATPVNAKVPLPGDEVMSKKENRVLRKALEAINEKKRKGDARNTPIGGEQEHSGARDGQNVGRKRSLPGERETRLKRKSTEPPQSLSKKKKNRASSGE